MDLWRSWATTTFALDRRSLGLFRIGLGVLVIVDALFRLRDVELFLSDLGMRPRGNVTLDLLLARPSFHYVSGETSVQTALLIAMIVVAAVYAAGWQTRLFSILTWAFVLSVQNRNNYINTGADAVLITSLFFAMFLPTGDRFSVDARARPDKTPAGDVVVSAAAAALTIQIVVIYVFNVVNKYGKTWWNGTAVLQALHIDQHTTALGVVVRDQLTFLAPALTWGTLIVEFSAVLLLLPVAKGAVRTGLVVAFWGLHAGLALCMDLGLFSPACMVLWLAVLPSSAWTTKPLSSLSAKLTPKTPTGTQKENKAVAVVVAVVMAAVVVTQLTVNVLKVHEIPPPAKMVRTARAFGLEQQWRLFSANPSRHDGWWVIAGTQKNGAVVDAWRGGGPVDETKPRLVADMYPTGRWRKLMMNNSIEAERSSRKRFAQWLCHDWNRRHDDDEDLVSVQMTFLQEMTRRDFKRPTKIDRQDMGRFVCAP